MKRRVIQLAGKTHVVSLPSKWIRSFRISKGDILDVEEQGNTLTVKPDKASTELKKISLNAEEFEDLTLKYTISALHKIGYDEIILYYKDKKFHDTIQHLLKNLLLGFVVIEQTSKKVVLKSIANEIDTEFDSTLRRAFLVTLSLGQSTLEAVSSNNFSNLNSLISLENTNNQLTSFCLRLINKGYYKDQEKKTFLVTIVWSLEKIADEYKAICINLVNNEKPVSKDILDVYKETNDFFSFYYEMIYSFSLDRLNNAVRKRNKLLKMFSSVVPKTNEETILLNRLSTIVSKTADLSSSILALHSKEAFKTIEV